jgi:hypothetical protein
MMAGEIPQEMQQHHRVDAAGEPDDQPVRPAWTCRARQTATRAAGSAGGLLFLVLAITEHAFETLLDEFGGESSATLAQGILQRLLQGLRHGPMIAMGAAQGFADDPVHQAERLQPAVAVMPIVSAASGAFSALFQRIEAQPSGEITE